MDEVTRRRALRSAAKVAFGASLCWGAALSGCGGKSVGDGEDFVDDSELGRSGAPATGGSAGTGSATGGNVATGGDGATGGQVPALACTEPLGPGNPALSRQSWEPQVVACCGAYARSQFPEGASESDVPEITSDASLVNCCRYVNAAYTLLSDPDYKVHAVCCTFGVLPESEYVAPFCTPWGPPVPPALAVELAA